MRKKMKKSVSFFVLENRNEVVLVRNILKILLKVLLSPMYLFVFLCIFIHTGFEFFYDLLSEIMDEVVEFNERVLFKIEKVEDNGSDYVENRD